MQQTMALMVMELYSTNLVAPFLSQKSSLSSILKPKTVNLHGRRRSIVRAIDGAAADFVPPEITWQITVGAIGLLPRFDISSSFLCAIFHNNNGI